MKKHLSVLLVLMLLVSLMVSCTPPQSPSGESATQEPWTSADPTDRETVHETVHETVSETDRETDRETVPESLPDTLPDTGEETPPETEPIPETADTAAETAADTAAETAADTDAPLETTDVPDTDPSIEETNPPIEETNPPIEKPVYTYTDFTPTEKNRFVELLGEVIPFVPNNEYYVEEYTFEDEIGLNFYTFDNTRADFEAYLARFAAYTLVGTYEDDYGDTWYAYEKGSVYVDLAFYTEEGNAVIDVYAYILTDTSDTTPPDDPPDDPSDDPSDDTPDDALYTDFTDEEKEWFRTLLGEVIPFVPNNEYYVEEYTFEDEIGLNFYTFDNTHADFEAYLARFAAYTLVGTYEDDYGDTWYAYEKGSVYVDLAFYTEEGNAVIDVYAYILTDTPDTGGGGGAGETPADVDLLTNDGKGLPTGEDGVYHVNFGDATYVQNVTEQGYYKDGCPTVGSPAVLVIPVDFSDRRADALGYDLAALQNAFLPNGVSDYHSVHDYYALSSYGQLTLDITVLDFWFRPQHPSDYYARATMEYEGSEIAAGDQMILDEALAYLESRMDLSVFDSDGNGLIDAVVMVNTLAVSYDTDFQWAYRYWNLYTDENDNYFEYDGVSANDYVWASYGFLHEGFDENGDVHYENRDGVATYTYIHEFGHILGADDYYDTAEIGSPMGGCDVMDAMKGDHNAYTKFNYGWISESRLITTESSVTLNLKDFGTTGDTILLANNWDSALGVYQEYYIVAYYRSTGLNSGEGGYFDRDGVVVYHVNASLFKEVYGEETYYDVYFNNTDPSDEFGTDGNLIEYVLTASETYTYVVGDTLPAVTDASGNRTAYTFTVDALSDEAATITFTRAA